MRLCERARAQDNDPPHRDEQRAWFDTLRDFQPLIDTTVGPTVRVHMDARRWCDLDPDDGLDAQTLRSQLLARTSKRASVRPRKAKGVRIATVGLGTSSDRTRVKDRMLLLFDPR